MVGEPRRVCFSGIGGFNEAQCDQDKHSGHYLTNSDPVILEEFELLSKFARRNSQTRFDIHAIRVYVEDACPEAGLGHALNKRPHCEFPTQVRDFPHLSGSEP